MKKQKIDDKDIVMVWTLNTWTDEKKAAVREALANGKWVYLGCTAIGHTRSEMTKRDGWNWLKEEYGSNIEEVQREGSGDICFRLVNTTSTTFVYNDGGRKAAGFKGSAGDCVCRAIAIATERPYKEVYELINDFAKKEKITKRRKKRSSARNGVYKCTIRKVMGHYGWEWTPTMFVGQGCKVHLRADELPKGRLVVNVSKHSTAVIDGVINDTYDCSRGGTRCVYGYYRKGADK